MKKIILVFAIAILAYPFFASSQETEGKKFLDNWSLNVNGGASLFWGDLRTYTIYPIYQNENERNAAFGFIISKKMNSFFELRGQFIKGNLSGTKRKLNKYFEAQFNEYTIDATINFSRLIYGDSYRKFTFYGIGGLGFVDFRSVKKELGSNKYISSNGYSLKGTVKENMQTETVIPFGFGAKYIIDSRFEVNFENIWTIANTDDIDVTRGESSHDILSYTSLGLTYNFNIRSKGNKTGMLINESNVTKEEDTLSIELNEKIKYLEEQVGRLGNKIKQIDVENKNKEIEEKNNKEKLIKSIYKSIYDSIQLTNTNKKVNCEETCLPFSIFFDVNNYNILDSEQQKLASIAELLKKDNVLKLRIIGRTDQSGTIEYNVYLSKKRAEAVLNTLVNKYKLDKSRFTIENKGKNDPFSKKHYSVNRRVDFIKQ